MLAVAHDARLAQRVNPKDPESPSRRQAWEQLRDAARARQSVDVEAEAALDSPAYPDWIEPLRAAHVFLRGRSGVGPDGMAPLSLETFTHVREHFGMEFEPREKELLLQLDTIARHPESLKLVAATSDTGTSEKRSPSLTRRGRDLWPTRKASAEAVQ